jgi:hypothetical protein
MHMTTIPSRNAALASRQASCNGSGVIVIPTEDGPWKSACEGCRNCTPTTTAPTSARAAVAQLDQRAAAVSRVFAATDTHDDDPF